MTFGKMSANTGCQHAGCQHVSTVECNVEGCKGMMFCIYHASHGEHYGACNHCKMYFAYVDFMKVESLDGGKVPTNDQIADLSKHCYSCNLPEGMMKYSLTGRGCLYRNYTAVSD